MFKRLITSLVCLAFIASYSQPVYAQDFSINQLPVPGTMVGVSTPFVPLALKGLIVNPQKPLEFQFIVDTGHGPQDTPSVKDQATQLVKYFLAGLTIPEGDLWVNLSPYEKDRMVPEALGQTYLGRDLLAQDYVLKHLTASLIYPEKALGKEFWSGVYQKAQKRFGTTNVSVNTFNKVWILPDQVQVYENVNAAYITKSTLKVMLDEDYMALQKHTAVRNGTDSIGANIVREIVLPEIEKEVNTGKNFAPLRQIYQALILAKWYKETVQNGLLDAVYTNKDKVAGVNLKDPAVKEQIYERYLQAYKKGAFNYIKEELTPEGQVVPRKYFSGGAYFGGMHREKDNNPADVKGPDGAMLIITIGVLAATTVGLIYAAKALSSRRTNMIKGLLLNQQFDSVLRFIRKDMKKGILIKDQVPSTNVHKYLEEDFDLINFMDIDPDLKIQLAKKCLNRKEFHLNTFGVDLLANLGEKLASTGEEGAVKGEIIQAIESVLDRPIYQLRNKGLDALRKLGDPRGNFIWKRVNRGYTEQITQEVSEVDEWGAETGKVTRTESIPHPKWVWELERRTPSDSQSQKIKRNAAMIITTDKAIIVPDHSHFTPKGNPPEVRDLGGIDLNQINVNHTGKTVKVQFDRAQLNQLLQGSFAGFRPVITNMTVIQSPFPSLGINLNKEEGSLAKL